MLNRVENSTTHHTVGLNAVVSAIVAVFLFVLGVATSSPAQASTTTWEPVDVTTAPFQDTMADGTVVTITFGTAAGFWASTHAPAYYKTDASGGRTNSTVRFSFSKPITNLKTYYAYLGYGDEEEFRTNQGPVNLSQTVAAGGNLVSSTGGFITGQPQGNYSSAGIVSSTSTVFNQDNSATLELSFPTGITYLEVRGAPSGPGTPGINLTGLSLPMTSYEVTFDPNGGTGDMATQTVYASSRIAANTFTRPGFRFTGWNTQPNGRGTSYRNEAAIPAGSLTLYAQWSDEELAQTGSNHFNTLLATSALLGTGAIFIALSRKIRRARS